MKLLSTTMQAVVIAAFAFIVATTGCTAIDSGPFDSELGVEVNPIIDGTPETGYRGIGALLISHGGGMGGICTGTHIGDGWILTAAHCVTDMETGAIMDPFQITFCLDSDVIPVMEGRVTGECFSTRSVNPNTSFNRRTLENDIALINVRGAEAVPTFTYNTYNLAGYGGFHVTWVGYGLNRVRPDDGDGLKRRGEGTISALDVGHIYYDGDRSTHMPCRGDSGGPALLEVEGEVRVVGVVSFGDEACNELGADTRVDRYMGWIADTMAGSTTADCRISGGDCATNACWPVEGGYACLPSNNTPLGGRCNADMETWGESLPCADGTVCLQTGASLADGECVSFCTNDSHCTGGDTCFSPIFEDPSLAEVGICMPPSTLCDLVGHDCPAGEGCFPTTSGDNNCFPSDGLGLGASCNDDMTTWTNLPCADGMICIELQRDAGGVCTAFCMNNTHCAGGEYCEIPVFVGIDDVGVCIPGTCVDNDGDGFCETNDCNDADPNMNPGAVDHCGDGIDQNCDGADVECTGCGTDADGDGHCVETGDCRDDDPNIHPAMPENCDDGFDNNCNGLADGAEESCGGGGGGGGGSSRGCSVTSAGQPPSGSFLLLVVGLVGLGLIVRRRRS